MAISISVCVCVCASHKCPFLYSKYNCSKNKKGKSLTLAQYTPGDTLIFVRFYLKGEEISHLEFFMKLGDS